MVPPLRQAVSIEDDFCECISKADTLLMDEISAIFKKMDCEYDNDYNYYTRGIKRNHNHARNIRKAVM